jgi:FMN phosphatase YigB (HAD superfamily)
MFAAVHLYDDAIPFLEMLRAYAMATAFVSNCGEDTRPLLGHLGVSTLVDALVLSCEIGSSGVAYIATHRQNTIDRVSQDRPACPGGQISGSC